MSQDPYVYPGTQTLINSENIRDPDELALTERIITRAAMRQPFDPPPDMTPEGLQKIHRHIFGDIYPWAGEFRKINVTKIAERGKIVEFLQSPFVRPEMQRFFGELQSDKYLQGLDKGTFAYRAAVYMEDLNHIHPFREGNGRAVRVFLEHLARQAGHTLDRTRIGKRDWMDGSIQSYRQPIDGAHDIMTRTITNAIIDNPHNREDDRPRKRGRSR
jgi:cell filamentation protein, protein adenylyltransferase